jgi:hypothetical protein
LEAEHRPRAEDTRFEQKDRTLQGATIGLGVSSGALLVLGLALHGAAQAKANRCASEIISSIESGPVETCTNELRSINNLVLGRDIALVGFGLTAAATIATGIVLGVHRSRGPERVAFSSSGVSVRF